MLSTVSVIAGVLSLSAIPGVLSFSALPGPGKIHITPGCLAPDGRHTDLWCPGDDNPGIGAYECYKIPTLLKIPNTTQMLAFIEARKHSCDDHGYVDLLLRRSPDDGKTWGAPSLIAGNSSETEWHTIGDALPIWDHVTGDIHLVYTRDNEDALYSRSPDFGASWAAPRNISDVAVRRRGPFLGTGHAAGLQLRGGNHTNRLLVPMYGGGSNSFVLASDDHGTTWFILGEVDCSPNEWAFAETEADTGKLIGSVRSEGSRLQAYSMDGGATWTTPQHIKALPEPVSGCEGALILHPNGKLYYSHPDDHVLRQKMNIKVSADGGQSWQQHTSLWGANAGCERPCVPAASYSSMVPMNGADPNSDIAILYMRNNKTMFIFEGRGVSFTTFSP